MKFKLNTKQALALLISILFIYTSCKKSVSPPATKTGNEEFESQVLVDDLNISLTEGFASFNISKKLGAPNTINFISYDTSNPSGNSTQANLCGLSRDTAFTYTSAPGGNNTPTTINYNLAFNFTCANSVFSGYNMTSKMIEVVSATDIDYAYKLNHNLTVLSLEPGKDSSQYAINGTIHSENDYNQKTGTKQGTSTLAYDYTFKSVIVDPYIKNRDLNDQHRILSGSATFTIKSTGVEGTWDYQGTITFLGGHKVAVTINGKTFTRYINNGALI